MSGIIIGREAAKILLTLKNWRQKSNHGTLFDPAIKMLNSFDNVNSGYWLKKKQMAMYVISGGNERIKERS